MIEQFIESSGRRWIKIFITLCMVLIAAFALAIALGSVFIPFSELLDFTISGHTSNSSWDIILFDFRLPKALTAVLVGAALGVSGLQMQTLFRNPLAGPYILGISSGAGLGVAITIFLGVYIGVYYELSSISRSWLLVGSAGLGSFAVLIVVALGAIRVRDSVTLLIIGLMFGAATGAIVSIMQFFSKAENIQAYVIWSFGSLGSLSWKELSIFSPIVLVGLIGSLLLSKALNTLLLGENYASSLGMNIKKVRIIIIINTSILAGTVTAFCGPIAFLGVTLPHIARMMFNTSNHMHLTPLVILLGAILMLIFDIIAQLPGMDATLPINAVTALFGAPFVIYILLRKNNLRYSY